MVWEQKGRIIRLRAAGRDTWDAERILQLLEANLKNLRGYKHALECDVASSQPNKTPARWCRMQKFSGRLSARAAGNGSCSVTATFSSRRRENVFQDIGLCCHLKCSWQT